MRLLCLRPSRWCFTKFRGTATRRCSHTEASKKRHVERMTVPQISETMKHMITEDYGKVDERVPHLLDRLRERGADFCWHKVSGSTG